MKGDWAYNGSNWNMDLFDSDDYVSRLVGKVDNDDWTFRGWQNSGRRPMYANLGYKSWFDKTSAYEREEDE